MVFGGQAESDQLRAELAVLGARGDARAVEEAKAADAVRAPCSKIIFDW